MSENNKVKVNVPVQPRAYEKLYKIPESAFADPEFPTYLEAQAWMQNFSNIPVIERYHATVIYNTPSYETEFGNIVVNPEYAWRVITDGFGGTDIVTYKTKPQTAKVIVWTAWADGDLEADLTTTVLYNNTGRTLSWNNDDARFELSGTTTQNYLPLVSPSQVFDTLFGRRWGKIDVIENKIGIAFKEGVLAINILTGNSNKPLTFKIEIYE